MTTAPTTPQERRLHVRGAEVRLRYAGGEGAEAVVFVHGNPGSADDWEDLLRVAGARLPAVAADLPGFGRTEAPAGFSHNVLSHAGFLHDTLEAQGITRVHLVLHDFGGPIGLAWAAQHAQQLRSVTLIDTGILPGYRWHRLARIWRTPVLGELVQLTTTRRAFSATLRRGEPQGLPQPFLERMYDHYDAGTRKAVLALYRSVDDPGSAAPAVTQALAEQNLPALVVWGEHDAYLPASYATRQREAFPEAEVHVLASSGHWPFVDARDTVARVLDDFLARHDRGRQP